MPSTNNGRIVLVSLTQTSEEKSGLFFFTQKIIISFKRWTDISNGDLLRCMLPYHIKILK